MTQPSMPKEPPQAGGLSGPSVLLAAMGSAGASPNPGSNSGASGDEAIPATHAVIVPASELASAAPSATHGPSASVPLSSDASPPSEVAQSYSKDGPAQPSKYAPVHSLRRRPKHIPRGDGAVDSRAVANSKQAPEAASGASEVPPSATQFVPSLESQKADVPSGDGFDPVLPYGQPATGLKPSEDIRMTGFDSILPYGSTTETGSGPVLGFDPLVTDAEHGQPGPYGGVPVESRAPDASG